MFEDTSFTSDDIRAICDAWWASATETGRFIITTETEKNRLRASGVSFPDLEFSALCTAIIGVSKTLQLGPVTWGHDDHDWLFAWCAELILGPHTKFFSEEQHDTEVLFRAVANAALASCPYETKSQLPPQAQGYLDSKHTALAYLSFPLLEATLRRACRDYVQPDGRVIKAFAVQTEHYSPTGKGRRRCNSIKDLLKLLYDVVAENELKTHLDSFNAHICSLPYADADPFETIYNWRNSTLHGESLYSLGGTIFYLTLLISLFEIKDNFNEKRRLAKGCIEWAEQTGRCSWSYYPPA